jgi:general stress protein YciG
MVTTLKERGKLGAKALNSDPEKKKAAARKAAATRKAADPDVFKKIGSKGGKNAAEKLASEESTNE